MDCFGLHIKAANKGVWVANKRSQIALENRSPFLEILRKETPSLFVSRLPPTATEFDISLKFPRATRVELARNPVTGRSRLYARVFFGNVNDLNQALSLNGTKLLERTLVLSLPNGGTKIPLYVKISNLPENVRKYHANLEILVTDLKRSTEELHLAPFFPRSAVISFPTVADGTRLGYARVLFQNLDDKLRALTRNGLLMENKRPLVMSVVHNGVVTPLYVLVRNLAPHVRQNHANQYFGQATAQGVFSIVPMFENQNINRGFCFVFPKSLQDLNSCLNLNGAIFAVRAISV